MSNPTLGDNLHEVSDPIFKVKKLKKKNIICLSSAEFAYCVVLFVCVEVLRPSQPNGVMSSAVSLPNHTFTGQA